MTDPTAEAGHPYTDACGFDRQASHNEDTYVCTCGYVGKQAHSKSQHKRLSALGFEAPEEKAVVETPIKWERWDDANNEYAKFKDGDLEIFVMDCDGDFTRWYVQIAGGNQYYEGDENHFEIALRKAEQAYHAHKAVLALPSSPPAEVERLREALELAERELDKAVAYFPAMYRVTLALARENVREALNPPPPQPREGEAQ